jgi:hypothetical protein
MLGEGEQNLATRTKNDDRQDDKVEIPFERKRYMKRWCYYLPAVVGSTCSGLMIHMTYKADRQEYGSNPAEGQMRG